MESATLSKYVPASKPAGYFYPQRDTASCAADRVRGRYSHYNSRVRGRYSHCGRRHIISKGSTRGNFIRIRNTVMCGRPFAPPPPQATMPGGRPGFVNPYPVPRPNQRQSSQFSGILSQFKKTNGQFDFNKMIDTTGQMVSAVNQVGSLVKGLTNIFK
nr:YppG family protein [Bacillus velezensis]